MATGWPMKTTYANGDVWSSSDANDITGTINLLTSSTLSRAAGKNAVINGGMDIWQRGTTFALALNVPTYTADRWYNARSATGQTVSRQTTSDTTNLPTIQYCARVQRDNANTSTAEIRIAQAFETVNSIPVAGQTVTLSFYARRGANYSSASNLLGSQIITGTGTDQNALTGGYTGQSTLSSATPTLTTTWQRFTQTATVSATATEITVLFTYTPSGTAGAADYFEVTGVQLELGSTATTFSRTGGTIQGELASCQRYYWRQNAQDVYSFYGTGVSYSTTQGRALIPCPVPMRVKPTSADVLSIAAYDGFSVLSATVALEAAFCSNQIAGISFSSLSTTAQGRVLMAVANNTTTSYLGFSAEL
jgi:hypothetical protein